MSRKPFLRTVIVGGLAGLTVVLALLHLIALTAGGEVRIANAPIVALAAGYDRKADSLVSSDQSTPTDLAKSERLSRLALGQFPYDTSSWLRVAYIDRSRHGELSPAGVAAIARSYDLIAVDPSLAPWRIRFALENWPKIPNDLRNSVRTEAAALSTDGRGRGKLNAALASLKDPTSAVIAALWRQRYVIRPARIEHSVPKKAARPTGY